MQIYYTTDNHSSSSNSVALENDAVKIEGKDLIISERIMMKKPKVIWENLSNVIDRFFDAKADALNKLAESISNGRDIFEINDELDKEASTLISFVKQMSKFIKITDKQMNSLHSTIKGDSGIWSKFKAGLAKIKNAVIKLVNAIRVQKENKELPVKNSDKKTEEEDKKTEKVLSKFEKATQGISSIFKKDAKSIDEKMQKFDKEETKQELKDAIKLDDVAETNITPTKQVEKDHNQTK
ncbi:hypothetical protein [Candidatus Xenohaliotis californiensis]